MVQSICGSLPYLKIFQAFRHDVIANLMPLDNIASVLGVPTHRTGTRAFVEATADLLCREW